MPVIRDDLAEAHRLAWEHLAQPGHWFTGEERVELAATVLLAIAEEVPLPPWVAVSASDRLPAERVASDLAHDVAYRLARHAGTFTDDVAAAAMNQLGDLRYVELCAIVSSIAAIGHFCRNAGTDLPAIPVAVAGEPTRDHPPIAEATLNWVPIAEPVDRMAAVVQAYTAVPREHENTWRLAAAQYMSPDDMVHPDWARRPGGMTRAQMELVAAKVAQLRECFY